MRIVSYDGSADFNDLETLSITIKAVPFEGGFVPAFIITSPDDDYAISLDELNALMDGVEIANRKVDDIITFLLRTKLFDNKEGPDADWESD